MADTKLRLQWLENQVRHLNHQISVVEQVLKISPESALVEARKSTEFILHQLHRETYGSDVGPNATIELLLNKLRPRNVLPRAIELQVQTIQLFGNRGGAHSGPDPDPIGFEQALPCLLALNQLVQWYFRENLRADGPAPAVQTAPSSTGDLMVPSLPPGLPFPETTTPPATGRLAPSARLVATYSEHRTPIRTVGLSRTGTYLASAGGDGHVILRKVEASGGIRDSWWLDHPLPVQSLHFHPDEEHLAFGDESGQVLIATVPGLKVVARHKLPTKCWSLAFHASGELLATGTKGNEVVLFRFRKAPEPGLDALDTYMTRNDVNCVRFAPPGDSLFFADDDGCVHRHRLAIPKSMESWKVSSDWLWSVDVHPSESLAVTGGEDGKVRILRLDEPVEAIAVLQRKDEVWAVRFAPNGEYVWFADGDGMLGAWDWQRHELLIEKPNGSREHNLHAMDLSRNGRFIVTGSEDGKVRLWMAAFPM